MRSSLPIPVLKPCETPQIDNLTKALERCRIKDCGTSPEGKIPSDLIHAYRYTNGLTSLTVCDICEINKLCLKGTTAKFPGVPRPNATNWCDDGQVAVGVGRYRYRAPTNSIKDLLDQFIKKYPLERRDPSLEHAFQAYYVFEHIHPFEDGNGRTGRLILSWLLAQHEYKELFAKILQRWHQNPTHYHCFQSPCSNWYSFCVNVKKTSAYFERFFIDCLTDLLNTFKHLS